MPHQFASGADEKVVRVFLAPKPFLTTLENISGIATNESKEDSGNTKRAIKGTVPELGLSNKVRKRPNYLLLRLCHVWYVGYHLDEKSLFPVFPPCALLFRCSLGFVCR